MERAEGLLGGKFLFNMQNYGTIDKTKVVCSICQIEFSHHRSSSSLSYHLNAKHPTESSPRLDGRQLQIHDFTRKITRPVREKVTNDLPLYDGERARKIQLLEQAASVALTGDNWTQSEMTITWVSQFILLTMYGN